MKQYFYLQLKRLIRIFPMLLIGTLVTAACVALLASAFWKADENDADKQRFKIAISGDTSGEYVQMGMVALQTFDSARFSMEVLELPPEEARQKLITGEISAYVLLPEDFIARALRGDVDKVTYVTHAGNEDIIAMFKNEVTGMISNLMIYSQKGAFAMEQLAIDENLARETRIEYVDELALSYLDLIFSRTEICTVDILGVSNGMGMLEYYISCLSVFLILFIGVAFVTVGVRRDYSLHALLQSKGYPAHKQVFWEYCAHFVVLMCLVAVLAGVVALAGHFLGDSVNIPNFFPLLLRLIPVAAMAAAINCLVFQFTENVISAVLWHFFLCLGQCYAAGCFYPVYTLPPIMQKVAVWLPAGLAREFVSGCFLSEGKPAALLGMLLFTALFWGLTVILRWLRLRADRR